MNNFLTFDVTLSNIFEHCLSIDIFIFSSKNPYDINSQSFDPELYTQRLIKEASLAQLMAHENETVKQIHSLDSDMQTLVSIPCFKDNPVSQSNFFVHSI